MTMASNKRHERFSSSSESGGGSFEEHNQRMRAFRLAHPRHWSQEHNQRMRAFRLAHPDNWRQWEHRVPEVQEGLPTLVPTIPLRGVVLAPYSAN